MQKAFDEIKKSEDHLRETISTIPALAWSTLPTAPLNSSSALAGINTGSPRRRR